jgi:hypothetical protein
MRKKEEKRKSTLENFHDTNVKVCGMSNEMEEKNKKI